MKAAEWLKTIYADSILCKLGKKISSAYHNSRIFSIWTRGETDASLSDSVLLPKQKETKAFSAGLILPSMQNTAGRMLHISISNLSLLILFWCLAVGADNLLDANYQSAVIFGILGVVCLPFVFVKATVYSLVATSLIGRFFELENSVERSQPNKWFLILVGILAILGGMYLPLTYSVLLPLIPIALVFLTYAKPIFFITLNVMSLPLFGTSACMVISVMLILSQLIQRVSGRLERQKMDYVDLLFLLYALLCVVASAFSFAVGDSFRIALMWVMLFSNVFIIYRNVRSARDIVIILSGLLFSTLISSGIGLFQYFSGQVNTTWTDTSLFEDLQIRIYSTFANPNVFGEFLLLAVPLAAGLGMYFKKIKYKIAAFLIAIVSLVALALTYSRGCYIGIAVTVVIFLWMYNKKILGLLALIGIPVGIYMLPQNMIDRILSMANLADSSTSYRLQIYEGTFNMLDKFWLSGVGIGEEAFNHIYPHFGLNGVVAPHSHSLFLQLVVTFGIAGIIYFAVMMFIYHRNILSDMHRTKKTDKNRILLITFGSILSGFLIQSIFDYTWYNYRVYLLFWIIIALGFSAHKILRKEGIDNA